MANHSKRKEHPITPGRLLAMEAGGKLPQPQASAKNLMTNDSFANLTARLGIQPENQNQISQSYYNLGPFISRNRLELEAMYRSSWLVGQVVDTVSEDMTREGISMMSAMSPDDISKLQVALSEFSIFQDICSTLKWSRLYGGAIAVMLIDGADYSTPLDIEKIRKNQFKGLVVLDRWMISPSMGELITDICKDIGKPKYYEVLSGVSTFPSSKIHYTRAIRFDGIELPYYQKLFENTWGLSVVERMLDRLIAFDSATTGAAQLLYKAYLRVIGVKGFREALANGGREEAAVIKQFQYIRALQSNEGITALDSEDTFNTHTYSFSGVSDMLIQFGQQISGATGIPLVRLFGQSPAGLSSTGESDIRNYYDRIKKDQQNMVAPQLDKLLAVMCKSKLGKDLPEDFQFSFNPLWQLSETEKAQIAMNDVNTQASAFGGGLITKGTALKELKQQSSITGRFTNITQQDIEDAENEPPPGDMFGMDEPPEGDTPENLAPGDPNERLGADNPDLIDEKAEPDKIEKDFNTGDSVKPKRKIRFRDALKKAVKEWLDSEELKDDPAKETKE